jgi:hypothetical protein
MAIILRSNGEIEKAVKLPKKGALEFLQKIVDGYIEIVSTKDKKLLIINEDGKRKGLQVNKKATKLYIYGSEDPIIGDAIVVETNELE